MDTEIVQIKVFEINVDISWNDFSEMDLAHISSNLDQKTNNCLTIIFFLAKG